MISGGKGQWLSNDKTSLSKVQCDRCFRRFLECFLKKMLGNLRRTFAS